MKLKVRYDERNQTIVLDEKAMEDMWICLGLENDEEMSLEEKEQLIQERFNEKFNRPEYNNLHKFERHKGDCGSMYFEENNNFNYIGPQINEVRDKDVFFKEELDRERRWEDDEIIERIYEIFPSETAEMIITIAIEGYSVREYASHIDDTPNNVSHRYRRALRKLKKLFK